MIKNKYQKDGFTLVEVVVVMAIIAVLAVLVVGGITVARNTAKETQNRTTAKAIQSALEAKYSQTKSYPDIAGNKYMAEEGGESFATVLNPETGALKDMGISASSCGSPGVEYEGGGRVCSNECHDDGYVGPYNYIIKIGNYNCLGQTSGDDQVKI